MAHKQKKKKKGDVYLEISAHIRTLYTNFKLKLSSSDWEIFKRLSNVDRLNKVWSVQQHTKINFVPIQKSPLIGRKSTLAFSSSSVRLIIDLEAFLREWRSEEFDAENAVKRHSWYNGCLRPLWSCTSGDVSTKRSCPVSQRRCVPHRPARTRCWAPANVIHETQIRTKLWQKNDFQRSNKKKDPNA